MSVARVIELSSTSTKSFEDAIQQGLERATKTLRNVKSAWIKEQQIDLGPTGMRATVDERTVSGQRGTVTIAQMPVASNLIFVRRGTPVVGKNRQLDVNGDRMGGEVTFIDRGVLVTVKGSLPIDELVKIADSMR